MADAPKEEKEGKPVAPPKFDCSVCEDTGTVHLQLTGRNGPVLREVPCPECDAGVHIAMERDQEILRLREDFKNLAIIALVGVALAVIALMASREKPVDGFAQAIKEEALTP